MTNREKVIGSLNKALTKVGYGDMDNVTLSEVEETIESAIALLKEQEPVKPKWASGIKGGDALCGVCWAWLFDHSWAYCPRCGTKVKWDD